MSPAATAWVNALISVGLVSLIPFVGLAALALDERRLRRVMVYLVSFAVGALLGGAFVHLIPEAAARLDAAALSACLLIGFLGFFLLEKFVWAHSHDSGRSLRPVATLYLVGDAVHNCVDGMAIAAAYLAGPALGLAATIAVVCHEVPEEIGASGILIHSGLSVRRAVLYNVGFGLTAIGGALLTLAVGSLVAGLDAVLLPLAAGNFIYIAAADLVPELHRARGTSTSAWQIALIALGIAVVSLVKLVE